MKRSNTEAPAESCRNLAASPSPIASQLARESKKLAYREVAANSASIFEVVIGCAEHASMDFDLTAIAQLDRQIRVIRIVVPSSSRQNGPSILVSDGTYVDKSMPFRAEEQVQSHVEQLIMRQE